MKEITDILKRFEEAKNEGVKMALATVVHVEGSSYRHPGARMLVTEDGQLTGAISGGCLEGDALRKALSAISQQQNKLVTYDTTDEDDAKLGLQLGCNGIVHILFEPIRSDQEFNPIKLLQELNHSRKNAVLVTLYTLNHTRQPGTSLLYRDDTNLSVLSGNLKEEILADAAQALINKASSVKIYTDEAQKLNAFLEFIAPPVSLVIAGAGNDVQPLVEIAAVLGWNITVVDGRKASASIQRFPKAKRVIVSKPGSVLSQLEVDARTVFVLMTHNYNYDLALLGVLIKQDCEYIGVLGPKKKLERMLNELREAGQVIDQKQLNNLYGPVGLDIGAETAEEIAVSIVAEIKAVLAGNAGKSLKEKEYSIHSSTAFVTND